MKDSSFGLLPCLEIQILITALRTAVTIQLEDAEVEPVPLSVLFQESTPDLCPLSGLSHATAAMGVGLQAQLQVATKSHKPASKLIQENLGRAPVCPSSAKGLVNGP